MTNIQRPKLAQQDIELLRLLATGLPLEAMARRLEMSERTLRRRIRYVCDEIGVSTRIEAVVWAVRAGLL